MNKLLKQYWYILLLILILPIGLNFTLRLNTTNNIIGNSETWLAFWSTYLASILGSLITLFVLYKTLKQNEANNEDSKELQQDIFKKSQDLQISIYQKGLEERRLQELTQKLKSSLYFLDYTQLLHYQRMVKAAKFEIADKFFTNETTRCFKASSSYGLDFTSANKDEKLEEFAKDYGKILVLYTNLVTQTKIIISILNNESFEQKKDNFKNLFKQSDIIYYFPDIEYENILDSKSNKQFVDQISTILTDLNSNFSTEYNNIQNKLILTSETLIRNKLTELNNI